MPPALIHHHGAHPLLLFIWNIPFQPWTKWFPTLPNIYLIAFSDFNIYTVTKFIQLPNSLVWTLTIVYLFHKPMLFPLYCSIMPLSPIVITFTEYAVWEAFCWVLNIMRKCQIWKKILFLCIYWYGHILIYSANVAKYINWFLITLFGYNWCIIIYTYLKVIIY